MDWVHTQGTVVGSCRPPWIGGGADRRAPECGGVIIRAYPPATLEHRSSPAGTQQREGNMGISTQASPGLGQRWRCRAMEAMNNGGLGSA
jgi:hypothetical protein